MSIIEEGHPQYVRMAYLAIVGSHTVNGVAELHSNLIKNVVSISIHPKVSSTRCLNSHHLSDCAIQVFTDFVEYYGAAKFTNVTNGVTPRRWLHQCNPRLSALITEKLGSRQW